MINIKLGEMQVVLDDECLLEIIIEAVADRFEDILNTEEFEIANVVRDSRMGETTILINGI